MPKANASLQVRDESKPEGPLDLGLRAAVDLLRAEARAWRHGKNGAGWDLIPSAERDQCLRYSHEFDAMADWLETKIKEVLDGAQEEARGR